MDNSTPAYGLWGVAIINAVVLIIFALSFTRPRTSRDWRSFGTFSAFLVALFTEMYGFPLTVYLLSGWLSSRYPGLDLLAHNSGHLWNTLLGLKGDPHLNPIHLIGQGVVIGGLALIAYAWRALYRAQQAKRVAMDGPYQYIRHPQYTGFLMIMIGFLMVWPTLVTLVMFPVLVVMYLRLAKREERESFAQFGKIYLVYAANTPAFLPRVGLR